MVINDVVEWIITIGFVSVGAVFSYTFNRINDMRNKQAEYQQDTERRLGEFIRREELNGILDRVEERMERQLTEMKDMIRQWIDRHDRPN